MSDLPLNIALLLVRHMRQHGPCAYQSASPMIQVAMLVPALVAAGVPARAMQRSWIESTRPSREIVLHALEIGPTLIAPDGSLGWIEIARTQIPSTTLAGGGVRSGTWLEAVLGEEDVLRRYAAPSSGLLQEWIQTEGDISAWLQAHLLSQASSSTLSPGRSQSRL